MIGSERDYAGALKAAREAVVAAEKTPLTDAKHAVEQIAKLAKDWTVAYEIALKDPDRAAEKLVNDQILIAQGKIDRLIDPLSDPPATKRVKDLLKGYFPARVQVSKVLAQSPLTSVHTGIADSVFSDFERLTDDLSADPTLGAILDGDLKIDVAELKIQIEDRKSQLPNLAGLDNPNLDTPLSTLKSTIAGLGLETADEEEVTKILSACEAFWANVELARDFSNQRLRVAPTQLESYIPIIGSLKKVYESKMGGSGTVAEKAAATSRVKFLKELELYVMQLLHEYNLLKTKILPPVAGFTAPDILRPSVQDSELSRLGLNSLRKEATIQDFLSEFAADIATADRIAREVIFALHAKKSVSITPEDQELLEQLSQKLRTYSDRQVEFALSVNLQPDQLTTMIEYTTYIGHYLKWLRDLRTAIDARPTTTGLPSEEEAPTIVGGMMRRFLVTTVGLKEKDVVGLKHEALVELLWGWICRDLDDDVDKIVTVFDAKYNPKTKTYRGVTREQASLADIVANLSKPDQGSTLINAVGAIAPIFATSAVLYKSQGSPKGLEEAVASENGVYSPLSNVSLFKNTYEVRPIPAKEPPGGFGIPEKVTPDGEPLPLGERGGYYGQELLTFGDYFREAVMAYINKALFDNYDSAGNLVPAGPLVDAARTKKERKKYNPMFNPDDALKNMAIFLQKAKDKTNPQVPLPPTTFHTAIAKLAAVWLAGAGLRGLFDLEIRRDAKEIVQLVKTRKTREKYLGDEGEMGNAGIRLTIPYCVAFYKPPVSRYVRETTYTDPNRQLSANDRKTFLNLVLDPTVPNSDLSEGFFPTATPKEESDTVDHAVAMFNLYNNGTGVEWHHISAEVKRDNGSSFIVTNEGQAKKLVGLLRSAYYYWNKDYTFKIEAGARKKADGSQMTDRDIYLELVEIWSVGAHDADPHIPPDPGHVGETISEWKQRIRNQTGLPIRTYKLSKDKVSGIVQGFASKTLDPITKEYPVISQEQLDEMIKGKPGSTAADFIQVEYFQAFSAKMFAIGSNADAAIEWLIARGEIKKDGKQEAFLKGGFERVMAADDQLVALIAYQLEILLLAELIKVRHEHYADWQKDPAGNIKAIKQFLSREAHERYTHGWREIYFHEHTVSRARLYLHLFADNDRPEGDYNGIGILEESRVDDLLRAAGLTEWNPLEDKTKK